MRFRRGSVLGDVRMLNRRDGVKPIISSLRKGGQLPCCRDMDYGRNDSLLVPFYGVTAATILSLSRFARLGGPRWWACIAHDHGHVYILPAKITPTTTLMCAGHRARTASRKP